MNDEWAGFEPVNPRTPKGASDLITAAGGRVTSTVRPTWIKDEVPGGPQSQERLRKLYEAHRGNPAAKPGYSAHETGDGVDFGGVDPSKTGVPFKKVFWENDHYHGVLDRPADDFSDFKPVEVPKAAPGSPAQPVKSEWAGFAPVADRVAPGGLSGPSTAKPAERTEMDELGRQLHRGVGMAAGGIGDTIGLLSNPLNAVINTVAGTQLTTDMGRTAREAVGAPAPENMTERVTDQIGEGMVGGGAFSKGAASLAKLANVDSIQAALTALADTPILDMLSGGTGQGAAQIADEAGIKNPYAKLAIGLVAGGAPFALKHIHDIQTAKSVGAPHFESNVEVTLPNARDASTMTPEELAADQEAAKRLEATFNDPNDHTKPAIGETPVPPPLTSRESFDDTAQLMSRFEDERLPNESREDFVRRKTAEETALPVSHDEAMGNVANDIAATEQRTRFDDRRAAPREGSERRQQEIAQAIDDAGRANDNEHPEDLEAQEMTAAVREAQAKQAAATPLNDNVSETPEQALRRKYAEAEDVVTNSHEHTNEEIDAANEAMNSIGDQLDALSRAGKGGGDTPPSPPPPPSGPSMPDEPVPDGFAGNINLDRVNGTKDLKDLYRDLAEAMPTNKDRHQGRAATEELANTMGMSPEELLQHNPKLHEAPQYAVALRNLLKQAGDNFLEMARKVASGDHTETTMRDFHLSQARMAAIMERTMHVTGVGGRLLDSFNIKAKGGSGYQKMLKSIPNDLLSDPTKAQALAELIAKTNDPAAQARILRDAMKPRAEDYIFSAWYNWGLLSGTKTHFTNVVSNAANLFTDLAEHGLAAAFGQVRRGSANGDRVMGREVAARMVGMMRALREVGPNMKIAFNEGAPLDQLVRMERPHVYGNTVAGKIAEAPTRAMAAEDEFFRTIASMSELYGMSFREAAKEGHKGKALWARAEEIARNPTDEIMKAADNAGKRLRFMDSPSFLGKKIEEARSVKPGDGPVNRVLKGSTRLLVPFVRTPDSLIRTSIRRSPLGMFDRYNKADWKAGGARRDIVKARITIGTGLAAYAATKAISGDLTGAGPSDPKARAQLVATGWQPNSIKVGDKYVNLAGYEPLSTNLTAVATLVERHKSGELDDASYAKAAEVHVLDFIRTMNDSAWTKNLTDTLSMLDPRMGDGKADNTSAGIASSLTTPAFLRQFNQDYLDTTKRDTRGDGSLEGRISGRIQSGIPGMSDKLPPSYDVYGRKVTKADAIGPEFASRLNARQVDPDPVSHEVDRLSKANGNKLLVGPPGTRVGGRRLSPSEFEEYQRLSGTYIHDYLSKTLADPSFMHLSDEEKFKEVHDIVNDMRKAAREELFQGESE